MFRFPAAVRRLVQTPRGGLFLEPCFRLILCGAGRFTFSHKSAIISGIYCGVVCRFAERYTAGKEICLWNVKNWPPSCI